MSGMTDQQGELDPSARMGQALEQFVKGLGKFAAQCAAQGALGHAYSGDYRALSQALKGMTDEQVARTRDAATILQAACDMEKARPSRKSK